NSYRSIRSYKAECGEIWAKENKAQITSRMKPCDWALFFSADLGTLQLLCYNQALSSLA
ncbi:hypothetical protein ATANTOWER_027811, partial [Ataeniobius toweri]|nr:hypothetical protein [Ataeniobius toweri]